MPSCWPIHSDNDSIAVCNHQRETSIELDQTHIAIAHQLGSETSTAHPLLPYPLSTLSGAHSPVWSAQISPPHRPPPLPPPPLHTLWSPLTWVECPNISSTVFLVVASRSMAPSPSLYTYRTRDTREGRDPRDRPDTLAVQLSPRLRSALDKNSVFKWRATWKNKSDLFYFTIVQ